MLDETKLTAGVFITLTLLLSVAYAGVDKESVYYCESRDLVGYCDRLSSGIGTRCYHTLEDGTTKYKTCSEGWKSIEQFIEEPEMAEDKVKVNANGKEYLCNVHNGEVQSYSKCSSGSFEAYLGELV
jgi:hypothetical protein